MYHTLYLDPIFTKFQAELETYFVLTLIEVPKIHPIYFEDILSLTTANNSIIHYLASKYNTKKFQLYHSNVFVRSGGRIQIQ